MARGGEGVGGGRRFESINITRNGKVINMDGDEMVRQNENDVRCTGGNLITRPPPRAIHADGARKGALLFLEGGEIGSFTLGSCSCRRLIADESANDSIITAKLWRQVSLAGGEKREGRASAYFPNANGRNNPYFTSR